MATQPDSKNHYLIIGPSGAGLRSALAHFDTLGFATAAGVPVSAWEATLASLSSSGQPVAIIPENPALLSPDDCREWATLVSKLQKTYWLKLLHLQASDDVLISRFQARQKPHILQTNGQSASLAEAIAAEKAILSSLAVDADYAIETSQLSSDELYNKIATITGGPLLPLPLTVQILSFGYKYGIPADADMMMDMRFLRNPFYIEELRPQTGLDPAIGEYLEALPLFKSFKSHFLSMMTLALQGFKEQGRSRVILAIGCTGGKHRSVYTAEVLAKHLRQQFSEDDISLIHRETSRWPNIAGVVP